MSVAQAKLGPVAVSRLGFGTLSLSPLQSSCSVEQGAELLCYAWQRGITFWDTAQIYQNYPLLRAALKLVPDKPVIATKTYAWSKRGAEEALAEARSQLDLDVIDIFLLHEQTAQTLPGHRPALEWLAGAKARGQIRAVGVSTHSVECVRVASTLAEIDIIHPLYNKWGVGIQDGAAADMAGAIAAAAAQGKGIYAMKILGGGTMFRQAREAITHVLEKPWCHSLVIGMSSRPEIDYNVALCSGCEPAAATVAGISQRRRLYVAPWCQGCGRCLTACSQQALVMSADGVMVDSSKCILCGYCSRHCPDMCLKII